MKVRLEIIDDDGIEIATSTFGGKHWKRRLLAFIDTVEDETDINTGPSSNSSYSEVPVAEQHAYQAQFVQQQVPNLQQPGQQAASVQPSQGPVQQQQVQQAVPQQFVQQQQVQQPMQQVTVPLQYQQQFQQSQIPAMQQNFQQAYPQYPVNQNNQQPIYLQPTTLPPVRMQQYGQPAQPLSSTVQQPLTSNQQVPPAVSNLNRPVQAEVRSAPTRRRTPMLQDRLNDMSLTISERLELFLRYEYPRVWFSSQDVQQHYERIYGTIKQSTVSTYLSRMFRKALLERRGNRTQREYRYIADEPESTYKMEEVPGAPVYHGIQY